EISAVGEPVIALAVSATNVDSVFASTAPSDTQHNHLRRSINGGQTFTDITGTLPDRFIRDIAVNPSNSQEIFVALSGFGAGHIFKSVNGGNTWTDISAALPDIPFHCVTYIPSLANKIFAGSDLGVFASTDGGNTWSAFNSNMPDGAMVFDLINSPADTSLIAFTHGYGAYKISLADFPTTAEENSFIQTFTQKIISNPSKDVIHLMINSGTEGNAVLFIYDVNGKQISVSSQEIHSGVNEIKLYAQNFSSGFYFVRTVIGKEEKVSKVIIAE
ncbi:MAG TPA: T9SS type A sorting domain-containing protein, partial [Bacteroidia bacterium]|nr:T9SS type A sorting domain-containing protein [Bacteroidia bacterium]